MQRAWAVIYLVVFAGAALLGYNTAAPGHARPVHPTIASGCIFTFAVACISTLLGFWHASTKSASFRLPSLFRRFPWFWWDDPLQAWFAWTLLAFGLLLGSTHALGSTDANAVWMLVWFACLFGGLVIGQLFGYVIYRGHIQKA
jgi:hypothetical protein